MLSLNSFPVFKKEGVDIDNENSDNTKIKKKSNFDTSLIKIFIKNGKSPKNNDGNMSSIRINSTNSQNSKLNKTFDNGYNLANSTTRFSNKPVGIQHRRINSTFLHKNSFNKNEKLRLNSSLIGLQPIYEKNEEDQNFFNESLYDYEEEKSDLSQFKYDFTPQNTPRIITDCNNQKPQLLQFSPIIYSKTRDSNTTTDTPSLDSDKLGRMYGKYYQGVQEKTNLNSSKIMSGNRKDSSDSYSISEYNFSNHKKSIGETDSYKSKNSFRAKGRKRKPEKNIEKFEINLEFVEEDERTTIMIRNIPNKYNYDMMLTSIDKEFKNKYDFFYLPIDFKNQCNMGYAFLNFVEPTYVGKFYNRYNSKKWECFNSEKICEITYARIQGREDLCRHFEDSRILQQSDKRHRPLILPTRNLSNIHLLVEKQVRNLFNKKKKGTYTKRNSK